MPEYFQLAQVGAVGIMLIMTWRLMISKDKASYRTLKELYERMEELVKEVTVALTLKNTTDDQMSHALTKLSEELRDIREVLKEKK